MASTRSEPLLGADRMTLLAPACKVALGVGAGAEAPGGLDDDVDVEVGPRQVAGIALAQDADLAAVEGDDVAVTGHPGAKRP